MCVCLSLHGHLGEEYNPCRRIHLPGIAHPVVRKLFQVLKVHLKVDTSEELVEKGVKSSIVMYFVNFG